MKGTGCVLVTNNPLVKREMQHGISICFVEGGYRDVLIRVRDMVHLGHRLYTHPLAGSVKPDRTPYRTVMVSKAPCGFCAEHSEIISDSIAVCDKFPTGPLPLAENVLKDLQMVDMSIVSKAVEN